MTAPAMTATTAKPRFRAAVLLPVLLLLAGGCASLPGGNRDGEEIADLKRQLNEEKRNATVGEIEVARLRDELARAKTALRQAEDELARRRSDDSLRSDTPIKPPKRVDQVELEEEPIAPPPLASGSSAPSGSAGGRPSGGGPKPSPFPADHAVAPPGEDPQVLYDRGYTLFHQKSYDLAEATFRTFLTRHPESDLADNANFWIGESYFARGDYSAALTEFADTVDRFPQGNKVSDALFKAGRCLEEMGRVDEARDTYREVQERFAGSVAASGAKERLDVLRAAAGRP